MAQVNQRSISSTVDSWVSFFPKHSAISGWRKLAETDGGGQTCEAKSMEEGQDLKPTNVCIM